MIEDAANQLAWPAELALGFEPVAGRTVLRRRGARGPLYVQRPFYPEGAVCHCYLLHPPGGVAGGDELDIDVHFAGDSHGLLTTPAATKFYRSVGLPSRLEQRVVLDKNATAEWLLQENLLFNGARADLSLMIDAHRESRFLAIDVTGLGRPQAGERFSTGVVNQRLHINVGGLPLLREHLAFNGGDRLLDAPWGFAGANAYGTLFAYPSDPELLRWLRRQMPGLGHSGLTQESTSSGGRSALTATSVDGLLIVRARSDRLDYLKRWLEGCWTLLREPVLGRSAVRPRVWNT